MLLHLYQNCQLIDKPAVDLGNFINMIIGNAAAQCLCDHPDSAVIDHMKLCLQRFIGQSGKIIGHKAVHMLLQGTDGFHQCALEVITDTHNLSGCFHLCT